MRGAGDSSPVETTLSEFLLRRRSRGNGNFSVARTSRSQKVCKGYGETMSAKTEITLAAKKRRLRMRRMGFVPPARPDEISRIRGRKQPPILHRRNLGHFPEQEMLSLLGSGRVGSAYRATSEISNVSWSSKSSDTMRSRFGRTICPRGTDTSAAD